MLLRTFCGSQALALTLSPLLALAAAGQSVGGGISGSATNSVTQAATKAVDAAQNMVAQAPSTILPTDVVPLPTSEERMSFGENMQLRLLQRLPARFYFNATCETSFRYETNVFQFPTKRKLLTQLPAPPIFRNLNMFTQRTLLETLNRASAGDAVFRVLPNVTGGWTFTPRTRAFVNYFMIRDSLFHWVPLNTVIHSIAYGLQQDIPVTRKGNLQAEIQFRELYQLHQRPVFDFLPALTFSYIVTPRTVAFVNALLQLRGKRYFQAPTREIDPFYTFGGLYQRGGWSFSATGTFVQNFREPFRRHAIIPVNNYSWILDFEIARRIIKQIPGLQVFCRAEPIYNFHSHNRPGLAGMDFRFFYGFRMALGKPPLTAALEQIRQQLEEQEGTPPPAAPPGKAEPRPSAFLMPYQLIAGAPQPIHGYLPDGSADTHPLASATLQPLRRQELPLAAAGGRFGEATVTPAVLSVAGSQADLLASASMPALDAAKPAVLTPAALRAGTASPPHKVMPAHADPVLSLSVRGQDGEQAGNSGGEKQPRQEAEELPKPAVESDAIPIVREDRGGTAVPVSESAESSVPASDRRKQSGRKRAASTGDQKEKLLAPQPYQPASRSSEFKMILVPPLPAVNAESKDNPFPDPVLNVKPPAMVNVVR